MSFERIREMMRDVPSWPAAVKVFLSFLAGACMVLALPPYNWWPCFFLGMSLFYIVVAHSTSGKTAFAYGWCFGFGYFVCGIGWIANALLVDGNDYAWAWPLAAAGLPALLALFTATASLLAVKYSDLKTLSGFALFLAAIMISEYLRGHILTGFPWNLYGYIWAETLPLAQLTSLAGIYGLSLLTLAGGAIAGFIVIWRHGLPAKGSLLGALLFLYGITYFWGHNRLQAHPTEIRNDLTIRLVQPNIAQEDKWNPDKLMANLGKLLELSTANDINNLMPTLIVWPETALTPRLLQDEIAATAIKDMMRSYSQPVFLASGLLRSEHRQEENRRLYYNSLALFDRRLQPVGMFDKAHLVPFGEYMPLQDWIPLRPVAQYTGFESGHGPATLSIPIQTAPTFSPLICYEVIFSGALTPRDDRPEFIVNVTNDGWYGDSAGPPQHFAKTRFRAIEEGLPVVRSANTGISGVIDPLGRIIYQQPLLTAAGYNIILPNRLDNAPLNIHLKDRAFYIILAILCLLSFLLQIKRQAHGP